MSKKIIAVTGATGAQGGGLVRAILGDATSEFAAGQRELSSLATDPFGQTSEQWRHGVGHRGRLRKERHCCTIVPDIASGKPGYVQYNSHLEESTFGNANSNP